MAQSIYTQICCEDLNEQLLSTQYPEIFSLLLLDRTTGHNIVWATDDYQAISPYHKTASEITVPAITGRYAGIIAPRIDKSLEVQNARTKGKAEVFTPSWVCNLQNNLIDEAWFGRAGVFNEEGDKTWKATTKPIEFSTKRTRSWKAYVDEKRLEITCGEAPYLVSRYDATTGEKIPLKERIGLLDRKLRVVTEHSTSEDEWMKWAKRAFEATYGFEYQGDNLLLARENLLATYVEYRYEALQHDPTMAELKQIATIISWNLWQMDGLTGFPPHSGSVSAGTPSTLLDLIEDPTPLPSLPCRIKDWRSKKIHTFNSLLA